MISRTSLWLVAPCLALLSGCTDDAGKGKVASTFGEANRQTFAAQVIDPDPQYEYLDQATSGEHAAQAVDRYRKDTVKKPDKVRSTMESSGSGGGSRNR